MWRADAYNQYPDENQEYFHPVDKFPDNKTGIKIIGYFRAADSDSKGITSDLTPDRTRGEKDNGRIFELNIHVPAGSTYKFTEENPLIVIDGGMGVYSARFSESNKESKANAKKDVLSGKNTEDFEFDNSRESLHKYMDLAEKEVWEGNLPKALDLYIKSRKVAENISGGKIDLNVTWVLGGIAFVYRNLGQYQEALEIYKEILPIIEKYPDSHRNMNIADCFRGMANCYANMNDNKTAVLLQNKGLFFQEESDKKDNTKPWVANDDREQLAYYYSRIGENQKALFMLQTCQEFIEKQYGKGSFQLQSVYENKAFAYAQMGDYNKSIEYNKKVLSVRMKKLGSQHPYTFQTFNELARTYIQNNDTLSAMPYAKLWADAVDNFLHRVFSLGEQQRLSWASDNISFALPATLFKAEILNELILKWKGTVLDSLMSDRAFYHKLIAIRGGANILSQIQKLKEEIAKSTVVSRDVDKFQVMKLEQQVDSLESAVSSQIKNIIPNGKNSSDTLLGKLRGVLFSGDVVLDFVSYKDINTELPCYVVSIVGSSSDTKAVLIKDAREVNAAAVGSRNAIVVGDEVALKSQYAILAEKLWKPVAAQLPTGAKRIFIGADNVLNFVSFSTLPHGDAQFLGEIYDFAYIGCGRDLLRTKSMLESKTIALYANPRFSQESLFANIFTNSPMRAVELKDFIKIQLPSLPGTETEAKAISSIAKESKWSAEVHFGTDATKSSVMGLKSPTILHLATHGFFLGEEFQGLQGQRGMKVGAATVTPAKAAPVYKTINNPMRQSGVALSGAQNTIQAWGRGEFPDPANDGILTAEEVAGLNLDGTWLVTLSACETGVGEARSGEGVFGLRRAFMMAGAQNLLMTLWPVSDETTPKIMADFYREALKTGDAAGSLAKVQREWLVKLRNEKGLLAAVRDAGPFAMVVMAKQDSTFSSPPNATPIASPQIPANSPGPAVSPGSIPVPAPSLPEQAAPNPSPAREVSPSATPSTSPSPTPIPDASPSSSPVLSEQAPLKKAA